MLGRVQSLQIGNGLGWQWVKERGGILNGLLQVAPWKPHILHLYETLVWGHLTLRQLKIIYYCIIGWYKCVAFYSSYLIQLKCLKNNKYPTSEDVLKVLILWYSHMSKIIQMFVKHYYMWNDSVHEMPPTVSSTAVKKFLHYFPICKQVTERIQLEKWFHWMPSYKFLFAISI